MARRRKTKSIDAEIKQIIWEEWDPIGVRVEAPDAEYNAHIGAIHASLARGGDRSATIGHLHRLATESMGLGGHKGRLGPIADSLLRIDAGVRQQGIGS